MSQEPTSQSPTRAEETLYQNPFVAIRQYKGYTFLHMVRSNGRLVSILPFKRNSDNTLQFLSRLEICPAHDDKPGRYSITGGVDPDQDWLDAAQSELLEESGYEATRAEFIDLGTIRQSKQEDTLVTVFAVDVSGKTQGEATGDGSHWEKSAWTEWVDRATGLTMVDPLFIVGIVRLEEHLKDGD